MLDDVILEMLTNAMVVLSVYRISCSDHCTSCLAGLVGPSDKYSVQFFFAHCRVKIEAKRQSTANT